ncbi:transcriptional regulatory protein [Paramyrothecium foliicola]|nr:transcriptional regulatory protein [Paramyrothecium foliicola]
MSLLEIWERSVAFGPMPRFSDTARHPTFRRWRPGVNIGTWLSGADDGVKVRILSLRPFVLGQRPCTFRHRLSWAKHIKHHTRNSVRLLHKDLEAVRAVRTWRILCRKHASGAGSGSRSYIESLKGRVRMLEARVQARSPTAVDSAPLRSSNDAGTPNGRVSGQQDELHRRSSGISPGSQSTRPPPNDTLHDEMGYLPLSAMAEQWEQPSSNQHISFQTQVQAATCASGSNPSVSNAQNAGIFGQLGDFHRSLLRQGLNLMTIDTAEPFANFIDLVKYAVPFICSEQLSLDYNLVLQAYKEAKVNEAITETPTRVILVHLAVATGILRSKDYRYMESYATSLALTSYQLVPRAIAISCDLEAVQILTMMAIFSVYSSFGGSTWHLLDLATTRCIVAGMHNVTVSEDDTVHPDVESRRRAFWAIYILDAYVSLALDRPFQIQDEDITTSPPSAALGGSPFQQSQSWIVQHAMLLHAVRKDPSKGMLFHFSNYRYWRDTAPISSLERGRAWVQKYQFHCMCCHSLISILALADEARTKRPSRTITHHAEQEFSEFLAALEEQCHPQGCALTTFDGIDAFNAGVSMVYVIACRSPEPRASEMIRAISGVGHRAMRLLAAISERFNSLRSLYEIFGAFITALQCGDESWDAIEALVQTAEMLPSRGAERLMRMTMMMVPHIPNGA